MNNKSFTLIEVITAITVLTVGVLGAFTVVQKTANFISTSSLQLRAIYLAQEGVEIARNIRDTNYLESAAWNQGLDPGDWEADYTNTQTLDFYVDPGRFLKIDQGFYKYFGFGENTKFKRKITITPDGSDILNISVEISWQEKGIDKTLVVHENLYNCY